MKFIYKINGTSSLEANNSKNDDYLLEDGKGLCQKEQFTLYLLNSVSGARDIIGRFNFSPMEGCCGIVISSYTELHEDYRKSFVSEPFRKLKTAFAIKLGYSAMIATSVTNIPASIKNMEKSGYKIVAGFVNKRTTNHLTLGVKIF